MFNYPLSLESITDDNMKELVMFIKNKLAIEKIIQLLIKNKKLFVNK